jgi:hypothetical protein
MSMIEYLVQESNKSKEYWEVYKQVGSILANELNWGSYYVQDFSAADKHRVDTRLEGPDFMLTLYDNGEAYANYPLSEVTKLCEYLELPTKDVKAGCTFWECFPVSEYMQQWEDVIPRSGLVKEPSGYYCNNLTIDDTEFYTDQWFENFDGEVEELRKDLENEDVPHDDPEEQKEIKEQLLIERLTTRLCNYVNNTENDYFMFEDYTSLTQWDSFCEFTGYPKREDYFGILSSGEYYEDLYENNTYISTEKAQELVEKELEKEPIQ